jgi:hypothetical protein
MGEVIDVVRPKLIMQKQPLVPLPQVNRQIPFQVTKPMMYPVPLYNPICTPIVQVHEIRTLPSINELLSLPCSTGMNGTFGFKPTSIKLPSVNMLMMPTFK